MLLHISEKKGLAMSETMTAIECDLPLRRDAAALFLR
jgi:hypothetical protein